MKILREVRDYIKFSGIKNKGIVFYSENSGYYKYFEKLIDDILSCGNEDILYVTSDYNDAIFKLNNPRIKAFYINKLLATFLLYLDCKVFVTTMAELGNHGYVRSKANLNIEYIYVFHAVLSTTMIYQEGAFDNYDTILAVGEHHNKEIRERESLFNLKEKNIINYGYPLLDKLYDKYKNFKVENTKSKPNILIAPSWQKDNILDLCINDILSNIDVEKYNITIRPHPEYLKRFSDKFKQIESRYKKLNINFDKNLLSNDSILGADLLITDWSGIAFEYAFAAIRPVLFINTPMKVHNENYTIHKNIPMEISLREGCGISVDVDKISDIQNIINNFFENYEKYEERIKNLRSQYIYNFGTDNNDCAKYILGKVTRK